MEYRDVHDTKEQLNYFLKQVSKSSMSSIQKKNILKFVEELKLGKAGQVKVKDRRIKNYLMFLIKLHKYYDIIPTLKVFCCVKKSPDGEWGFLRTS
ncbi:MAG: hypothetical protein Q8N99_01375 [Nanoarchaeota archaeon]|nr:hypothetical protein [Nanoarchaeota archaeon]